MAIRRNPKNTAHSESSPDHAPISPVRPVLPSPTGSGDLGLSALAIRTDQEKLPRISRLPPILAAPMLWAQTARDRMVGIFKQHAGIILFFYGAVCALR